jgi:hypothetical protein
MLLPRMERCSNFGSAARCRRADIEVISLCSRVNVVIVPGSGQVISVNWFADAVRDVKLGNRCAMAAIYLWSQLFSRLSVVDRTHTSSQLSRFSSKCSSVIPLNVRSSSKAWNRFPLFSGQLCHSWVHRIWDILQLQLLQVLKLIANIPNVAPSAQ